MICSFSFKQSRHHFVLTLHGCYCPNIFHTKTGSYFEALIFQSSFNSCVSFFYFLWLKDFLWFKYRVLKHFSCKGQSVFLIKLHVLLWKLTGGWRIFLLCELMDELMADLPIFVAEDCCASSMNLWVLKKLVLLSFYRSVILTFFILSTLFNKDYTRISYIIYVYGVENCGFAHIYWRNP